MAQNELEAAQESLKIFYEWLEELPLEDAETAIRGLQAYMDDILTERDIEQGWHRISRDTDTGQQE